MGSGRATGRGPYCTGVEVTSGDAGEGTLSRRARHETAAPLNLIACSEVAETQSGAGRVREGKGENGRPGDDQGATENGRHLHDGGEERVSGGGGSRGRPETGYDE